MLAALAGLFCERSGIVDIALEGKMLAAAFAAAASAAVTGSAWLGLGAGIAASAPGDWSTASPRSPNSGNQVVSGMALNITVAGLAPTLGDAWFRQAGRRRCLGAGARFGPIDLAGRRGDRARSRSSARSTPT